MLSPWQANCIAIHRNEEERLNMRKITLWMALAAPAWAQDSLSLREALEMALRQHPSAQASQSGVDQAGSRIRQAHSGNLPKVNVSES